MGIRCCTNCVPPKRHSGCHGTCPEYTKEKAEHEAERESYIKKAKAEGDAKAYTINHVEKLRKERKRKNR